MNTQYILLHNDENSGNVTIVIHFNGENLTYFPVSRSYFPDNHQFEIGEDLGRFINTEGNPDFDAKVLNLINYHYDFSVIDDIQFDNYGRPYIQEDGGRMMLSRRTPYHYTIPN